MRSKRCSTISTFSQDSGFTSQDTFSIRSQDPSSPQKTRGAQMYCRGYTTGGSPLHPYSTIRRSQSPFQTGRAPHYSAPLTGRPPLPRRPPPPPRCSSLDRHSGQLEAEEGAKSQDGSRPQSQLSQTHKAKPCQSELSSPAHTQRTGGGAHSQRSSQQGATWQNNATGGDQISRQQVLAGGGGGGVAPHYSAPSNNSLVPPPRPFPSIRQNGQSKSHFREASSRPS